MLNNLNDIAALEFLLSFIQLPDLIKAAMNGFADIPAVKDEENADICYKVLKVYFNK